MALALTATLTLGTVGLTGTSATAAAPVAGDRTSGDSLFPNVGNDGYDVQHYDLDIAWTPGDPVISASTIDATATIAAKAPAALSEFSLDFEGLTVDSVTVDGAPATWERDVDADVTKYKLVVTPAEPVEGDFTAVIDYSGTPVTHIDPDGSREGWVPTSDGATAVNEPVGAMTWYPVNNSLRDKAKYDIKLTIPRLMDGETMAAASNGYLRSKTRDGALETWHWRQPNQMVPYLSMVSIGKYEVRESVIELESGPVRDWTFIDPTITANQRATTLTSLAETENIMRWMESRFGPYPGAASGAVVDNLNLGYALETQDRSYYSRSVSRGTLIHEIAHQWFGNAVSPTDWSDLWLNEGAGDLMPRLYNFETGTAADSPEVVYHRNWNNSPPTAGQWQVPLAGFDDPAILFDYVYGRGGMTYEVVRTLVGDDDWFEIMRTWVAENNGSDASTADFVALAERISGKELEAALQPWLYGTSKPAAWPAKWSLSVESDSAGPLASGDAVVHTVTAQNTGRVALDGQTVTIDVEGLVDDAELGDLPDGVVLDGTTLTWTLPETAAGATANVSFPAVVREASSGGSVDVTVSTDVLGVTCDACTVATSTVEKPVAPAPVPTISGASRVGSTLTAVPGTWLDGAALTYQWSVGGKAVRGATASTYRVAPRDRGRRVTVAVTGSRDGWTSVTQASAPTAKIVAGRMVRTPRPTVRGKAKVSRVLRVGTGTWDPGAKLSYRWYRGGKVVKGATKKSYKLKSADRGKHIRVKVTARKNGYVTVVKVSRPTPRVIR